ncbi:RNA recognition motif domain-containing protein [Algisphaera agarilytica]|uniref:RNA recognition motif-containing protein n=1 Tax=Algisphaera agarilytica TaxID=1385975 RepID=A0A7X0LM35_9BACT|nr:RNA-binding protein [Algisphaera agarilytica]MBB6430608.1 RNA recognition motif-containing protein [Algisphaera agarilytica]
MKFYVGNLNFRVTEDELRALFEPYGPINDLIILTDRETGRSRGFGFITLADDEKAKQAYDDLNQKDFEGRTLVMNEARDRNDRPTGGGYAGGGQQPARGAAGDAGYTTRSEGGYSNRTYTNNHTDPASEVVDSSGDDDEVPESGGYSGGYSRGGDA